MTWFGVEATYFVFAIIAVIFALFVYFNVLFTLNYYKKVTSKSGITDYQAARKVLDMNGLHNVKIERVESTLTGKFNPRKNVIRLSNIAFNSTSVASIGVACHEVGHAIQFAQGYSSLKISNALFPITKIGSRSWLIFIILGTIFTVPPLVYFGILLFGVISVCDVFTLPVEFNASRRAMASIREGGLLFDEEEKEGARKVLTAAALTYVASFVLTLAYMFRFIFTSKFSRRR